MTKEDLTRLDNYGHKPLQEFSDVQLKEYMILLEERLKEVADQIWKLRNQNKTKSRVAARGGAEAARRGHNPEVVGSNPTPATKRR